MYDVSVWLLASIQCQQESSNWGAVKKRTEFIQWKTAEFHSMAVKIAGQGGSPRARLLSG